jgi:hypothetical protein
MWRTLSDHDVYRRGVDRGLRSGVFQIRLPYSAARGFETFWRLRARTSTTHPCQKHYVMESSLAF